MRRRERMIHIRVTDEVYDLLKEVCPKESTTVPNLFERMLRERKENPTQFFAQCTAFQTNAIYFLLGQLVMTIAADRKQAAEILTESVYRARDIYGPMPDPPAYLAQREHVDPKVAAIWRAFFPDI